MYCRISTVSFAFVIELRRWFWYIIGIKAPNSESRRISPVISTQLDVSSQPMTSPQRFSALVTGEISEFASIVIIPVVVRNSDVANFRALALSLGTRAQKVFGAGKKRATDRKFE